MKLDTAILIAKGFCYLTIGLTAPLSSALAQWANDGRWPDKVNWVVIGGLCLGSAASSLLAFLSGSYKTWSDERKNGKVQPPQ
jgi:hypothetical protein